MFCPNALLCSRTNFVMPYRIVNEDITFPDIVVCFLNLTDNNSICIVYIIVVDRHPT